MLRGYVANSAGDHWGSPGGLQLSWAGRGCGALVHPCQGGGWVWGPALGRDSKLSWDFLCKFMTWALASTLQDRHEEEVCAHVCVCCSLDTGLGSGEVIQ